MTATLATAALLLVPFLAVVLVGALAVAVHDAIARAWSERRRSGGVSAVAWGRRSDASRGSLRRRAPSVPARSTASTRPPVRRAPVVVVR